MVRSLLILGRISNLPTIWTNVAVGWFLSGGSWTLELLSILSGMSLLYLGGMYLNDAFDAKWDRENAPTRPIPAGKISARAVWFLGILQIAAGVGLLLFGSSVHPSLILGLVVAILLYNWIHKRWSGSVLVMGLCRAFVYLGAGSAVASQITGIEVPGVLYAVAIAILLYIAGLTLAARNEHLGSKGHVAILPRLLLTLPVLFPLLGSRMAPTGPLTIALTIIGVLAIWAWVAIFRAALSERIPKGIAYAIAGIALYDAAIVSFADWRASIACLAAFGLTLAAQRVIPAT